jgi:hypothetical protein
MVEQSLPYKVTIPPSGPDCKSRLLWSKEKVAEEKQADQDDDVTENF